MLWAEAETLVLDLPLENKLGNKPFHPKEHFAVNFFGHIESIANLPGAETHWQDTGLPEDPSAAPYYLSLLFYFSC